MMNPSPQLSLDALPDPALVACAQEGNPECFASLFKRYQPKVRRSVGRLLGPAEYSDLEDLEQETFLKAWRHLGQFQGRSSFRTWLTRIAINEVRMKHRWKASQRISASLDDGQPGKDDGGWRPKEVVAPGPDIESWLIEEELDRRLMEVINELPAPLHETVHLRLTGLAEKDVARHLGLSLNAVKSRMHRSRRKLRQSLRQEEQARGVIGQHPANAQHVVGRRERPAVPARV